MPDLSLSGLFSRADQPPPRAAVPDIGVTSCDQHATAREDPDRAEGVVPVDRDALQAPAAIAACTQALQTYPGHPRLLSQLGRSYEKAYLYAPAQEAMRQAAEAGYPYAVHMMGRFYQQGWGVPRDHRMAESWYRKAIVLADGGGQNGIALLSWRQIGLMYAADGETRNWNRAVSAFEHGAKAGDPEAMAFLGYALYQRGGRPDGERALAWSLKAAEAGNVVGMLWAGHYYNGRQEHPSALRWYQEAAAQGNGAAVYMVGLYWERGLGVPSDNRRALQYYGQAAEAGIPEGAVRAALLHAKGGGGVLKDDRKAMALLRASAPRIPGIP